MGSYGIGPGRVMAAAVEQRHDENGIVWPRSIAPYDVHVLALHGPRRRYWSRPSRWPSSVERRARACCSTTGRSGPGEKFADADLLGVPIRITVGKKTLDDGAVDVRIRADRGGRSHSA